MMLRLISILTLCSPSNAANSDPDCAFGISTGTICCPSHCSYCTGDGCSLIGTSCCGGPIERSGLSCDDNVAPCIISTDDPTNDPTVDPTVDPTINPTKAPSVADSSEMF